MNMTSKPENNDHLASTACASVDAWTEGKTDMPQIALGEQSFPFQGDYVDVHFMGEEERRVVFTTAPSKAQREPEDCYCKPMFTCDALKATLELDDPVHSEILKANLTTAQWEQLTLAANLSESGHWGIYPSVWEFLDVVNSKNQNVSAWGTEMAYRFENCCPLNKVVFNRDYLKANAPLRLRCRDFIEYLHDCSAIADVLTPLCDGQDKCRDLLVSSQFEMLGQFYESIRPAADLYRTLPEAAIRPFIEIGSALQLLKDIDKATLLRLHVSVTDIGFKLDDNPARSERDEDGKIERWWKWTEPYFDYIVHYGLSAMTRLSDLRHYAEHLQKACDAFDPANKDNVEVLQRLDEGWASRGFDSPPIIKDLQAVFDDLTCAKAFFEKALSLCDAGPSEFELPSRPSHFCKPMPYFPTVARSVIPFIAKSEEEVCKMINSHLGEALSAGKKVTVTGEEETPHYFHGAQVQSDEIVITYGSRKTKVIKSGPYGAGISKSAALRLLRVLSANETQFQCRDTDEEPLAINIQ